MLLTMGQQNKRYNLVHVSLASKGKLLKLTLYILWFINLKSKKVLGNIKGSLKLTLSEEKLIIKADFSNKLANIFFFQI